MGLRVINKLRTNFKLTAIGGGLVLAGLMLWSGAGQAAWQEPSAAAPDANIYAPITAGPEHQAKKGRLLLDPLYNLADTMPSITYPLEVRGPDDSAAAKLRVSDELVVDTDTLYASQDSKRVGLGTTTPSATLDIEDGTAQFGSAAVPIFSTALEILTPPGVTEAALYGATTLADVPSVVGESVLGHGIFGYAQLGTGVYGESVLASGVSAATSSAYSTSPSASIASAIYGSANGGWAGYFTRRLYASDVVTGRKFVPNSLEQSLVAYTAGWEVRDIIDSKRAKPIIVAYDGNYLWVHVPAPISWDDEDPYFYIIDPKNGSTVEKMRLEDSVQRRAHDPREMISAEGSLWTANASDDDYGLSRIDIDTRQATHFDSAEVLHGGFYDGAIDLAYDTLTAGGPYIWMINYIKNTGTNVPGYSLSRFNTRTETVEDIPFDISAQTCISHSPRQCSDGIDNDGDGSMDSNDSQCANPYNEVTNPFNPGNDERLVDAALQVPTGIALDFDNNNVWISFRGTAEQMPGGTFYYGEGIAKVPIGNPSGATVFCTGPAREPRDIAYGDGHVWVAKDAYWNKVANYEGFLKIDPASWVNPTTWTGFDTLLPGGVSMIKYDDESKNPDGAFTSPYIWTMSIQNLRKYDTNGAVAPALIHDYELPRVMSDIEFDRTSGDDEYIWGGHYDASLITRNVIDSPHSSTSVIIQGAGASDLAYDGTFLWTANNEGNTISKYRSADGFKMGDYAVGWNPRNIVFDGRYLWVTHGNRGTNAELAKFDPLSNTLIGDYDYRPDLYIREESADLLYDGKYLWTTDHNNDLLRIDPASCNAGMCTLASYAVGSDPHQMAFDGEYLWVTHDQAVAGLQNTISKVQPSDGSVVGTFQVPDAYNAADNLTAITFDGTYLWVGTKYIDAHGKSVYKIRPEDGSLAGSYQVYTEPGLCSGGDRNGKYCTSNSMCTGGGTCTANQAIIRDLVFDGTNVWVLQGMVEYSNRRECTDGTDNDNDGVNNNDDPECQDNDADLHEDLGNECNDRLDNDGNGRCDFDGAAGYPGCSGIPDPGCSSAIDQGEASPVTTTHVSRILPGAGQVVESIGYAGYCWGEASIIFDGQSVWTAENSHNCDQYPLHQFYSGSGYRGDDLTGVAQLQGNFPGRAQLGGFSLNGNIELTNKLVAMGDLVLSANIWGGVADTAKAFNTSCDEGEFVKGVDLAARQAKCRPL